MRNDDGRYRNGIGSCLASAGAQIPAAALALLAPPMAALAQTPAPTLAGIVAVIIAIGVVLTRVPLPN
jgi:hypothetical protein